VVVWNKKNGNEVKRLAGHTNYLAGVTLHPGNPWELISYEWDGSFIVQAD
jgi:hypothetical protein